MKRKFSGLRTVEDSISMLLKPISKGNSQKYALINSLVKRWPDIVGPKYSKFCHPQSVQFDKYKQNGAKLTIIAYNSASGFFLKNSSEILIDRIESLYGHKAIKRIYIKQEPKQVTFDKEIDQSKLTDQQQSYIKKTLSEVEDDELKKTLTKLAAAITIKD